MLRRRIAKNLQWDLEVTHSDPETYAGENSLNLCPFNIYKIVHETNYKLVDIGTGTFIRIKN